MIYDIFYDIFYYITLPPRLQKGASTSTLPKAWSWVTDTSFAEMSSLDLVGLSQFNHLSYD